MNKAESFGARDAFGSMIGIKVVEMEAGQSTARLRIDPCHFNGLGMVQGGVIFTLADVAFAAAVNAHEAIVGIGINATVSWILPVQEGVLIARAREISRSHRLASYLVTVHREEDDAIVATFQGTAYLKQARPT